MKTLSPRALAALVFVTTLLAYLPALSAGFIWDDQPGHVTRPDLRSLDGLVRIWTEPGATQQYYPLLHSAFWLEHRLFGDAPFGYHLINLLLHATAACLFAAVLRRLAVPGAWLAALLFALHPVCVESVAWVSEQKNTLSLVLYLGAALAYLRFDCDRRSSHYACSTIFFIAALLTKTVTATLPAALLVVFWWQRGRLSFRRDALPLLPWFAGSALAAVATAGFEHTLIGAQGADFSLSGLQRGVLAGRVIWFYLGKLLWPADLIFVYPRWTIEATTPWPWVFPFAALALLGALAWWSRRSRGPLAAALLFSGSLFPALGFIDVYPFIYSFVADHFQYLPSLALFALVAAGLTRLPPAGLRASAITLLLLLGSLTFQQTRIYRDLFTLYEATIVQNPDAWMAHNNLGVALVEAGRTEEALPHFEQAIKLRVNYAEGKNNLGDALNRLGRSREASPHLEHALRLQPNYAEAHNNLGVAFMATNRPADGLAQFATTVRLKPGYAVGHRNLGRAIARSGRTTDAIPHFARAVQLDPGYAVAHLDWAIALTLTEDYSKAFPHFDAALELDPASPDAHLAYGRALVATGRLDDAISHYKRALELKPNSAETHFQLALVLRQIGRLPEATSHYTEAQRLGHGQK
ncbi:MAG: tetratricopeptide repeat protein [Opitutus sp.]|nr:tetratricopeptide repeat protein [Opitutus sp.]